MPKRVQLLVLAALWGAAWTPALPAAASTIVETQALASVFGRPFGLGPSEAEAFVALVNGNHAPGSPRALVSGPGAVPAGAEARFADRLTPPQRGVQAVFATAHSGGEARAGGGVLAEIFASVDLPTGDLRVSVETAGLDPGNLVGARSFGLARLYEEITFVNRTADIVQQSIQFSITGTRTVVGGENLADQPLSAYASFTLTSPAGPRPSRP